MDFASSTRAAEDRPRWKGVLNSGQGWTLQAQLGQLKTGLGGKGLL